MSEFQCFRPDYGHTLEDDAETIEAFDPGHAAEKYVEKHFANWEYPTAVTVHVRPIGDDRDLKFEVISEAVPVFHAVGIK